MSLLDDIRTERERDGITSSTKGKRLIGLYGETYWDHEPLRHPEAIKAHRAAQQAALEKHRRDLDEADRLMAENSIPWWEQDEIDRLHRIKAKKELFDRLDAKAPQWVKDRRAKAKAERAAYFARLNTHREAAE